MDRLKPEYEPFIIIQRPHDFYNKHDVIRAVQEKPFGNIIFFENIY